MTRVDRSSLLLRAQEVIHTSREGITAREAMKRVLAERYASDPSGLLEYAASLSDATLRTLRRATYNLPSDEPALFDVPAVIAVTTPDGDLFLSREIATLGQVRQWIDEGEQYLAVQSLRFRRFRAEVDPLEVLPDDMPWRDARALLSSPPVACEVGVGSD